MVYYNYDDYEDEALLHECEMAGGEDWYYYYETLFVQILEEDEPDAEAEPVPFIGVWLGGETVQ